MYAFLLDGTRPMLRGTDYLVIRKQAQHPCPQATLPPDGTAVVGLGLQAPIPDETRVTCGYRTPERAAGGRFAAPSARGASGDPADRPFEAAGAVRGADFHEPV